MSEAVTGYVRPRRGKKLEAVLSVDGRVTRKALGLDVGQEDEAQAVLEAALAKLRTADVVAGELTVKAWGEKWIADRKARGKGEWVNEETHLEAFLYPTLGALQLVEATDVRLLDWARGLEKQKGPSGKNPSPKYVRKITATVRSLFKEAVRRHLVERTPCIWEESDLPELEANSRVVGAGFEIADVARLVYDPGIPEDRRILYGMEFLTGMRTGEAAARTWADWEPVYRSDLGRLVAATAYNTRQRALKTTKTRVEKWLPVHPALAELLARWKAEGWERFHGRAPKPEDLIVPAATLTKGGQLRPRNNSYSWRCFRDDLVKLGIAHQRHYESRSTFINLAEAGGASPADVHRLTHASLGEAKDLYRRIPQQWPRLCAAVRCIALSPPGVSPSASPSPASDPQGAGNPQAGREHTRTALGGRARESNACATSSDRVAFSGSVGVSVGSLVSVDLVERVAAAGARAAAALAAGDLDAARRVLSDALAALGPGARGTPLRLLAGQGGAGWPGSVGGGE